ncbi:MAG: zinc ribbon domain-containing protein, partial [Turicibacter sanguinis]
CYRNGRFIKPDMTLTDMKKQVIQMIDQAPVNKFQKWMLKKIYPLQLKTLKRWRD